MPWDRVHDEAEVLEHYISEELEERIAEQARRPEPRPARRPDPEPRARRSPPTRRSPRSSSRPGTTRVFARVSDRDPEMLRYLDERGIRPGAELAGHAAASRSTGRCSSRSSGDEHALGSGLAAAMRVSAGVGLNRALDASDGVDRRRPSRHRPRPTTARGRRASRRGGGRPRRARARSTGRVAGSARLWPFLGPAFIAAVAYIDPGNFATNIARRRAVRVPAALGRRRREPDRDADPDPVGEARHRDRQEPAGALPRDVLAPHARSASGCRPSSSRWRPTSPRSSARRSGSTSCSGSRCSRRR